MAAHDPAPDSGAAERITALVLLLMVGVLAWLRFGYLTRQPTPPTAPFDLRNPMLDAKVGECVEVEDSSEAPGTVTCAVVIEPGVVLRPALGPEGLGSIYDRLRRMPPYLACAVRFPKPGSGGCAPQPGRPEEVLLYDLNLFGMPSRIHAEPIKITPVWKRWGGRAHYAYQVEMLRHGSMAGPWIYWVSEEAPVTGTIYREYSYGSAKTRQVIYREVEGCLPPS